MVRGTTPTVLFCSKQIRKEDVTDAEFTFLQKGKIILTKEMCANDESFVVVDGGISVTLSQIETLMFDARVPLFAQLRVKMGETVLSTPPSKLIVEESLDGGVLT